MLEFPYSPSFLWRPQKAWVSQSNPKVWLPKAVAFRPCSSSHSRRWVSLAGNLTWILLAFTPEKRAKCAEVVCGHQGRCEENRKISISAQLREEVAREPSW